MLDNMIMTILCSQILIFVPSGSLVPFFHISHGVGGSCSTSREVWGWGGPGGGAAGGRGQHRGAVAFSNVIFIRGDICVEMPKILLCDIIGTAHKAKLCSVIDTAKLSSAVSLTPQSQALLCYILSPKSQAPQCHSRSKTKLCRALLTKMVIFIYTRIKF